ncbi:tetratricopeptide repeat protein [Planctomycetota bacterium]|nr:tetratricopeptide repeat protein [Planctomycetota bacterium]
MDDDVEKLRTALDLYQQGDYTRAEILIESIFSGHLPDELLLELHYLHGLILINRGDLLEAAIRFQNCAKLDESFFPALDAWGNVLSNLGDFRGALDKYRRAEAVAPPDQFSHVLLNQGKVLLNAGYVFKALKRFYRAAKLDLSSDDACYYTGLCLLQLKRNRHAKRWMKKAVDVDPNQVRNLVGLGNALSAVSRFTKAEATYQKAIEADSKNVEAWYNYSRLQSVQKKYAAAIKICKAGQKHAPQSFELLAQHLFCLRQMGAYDAALAMAARTTSELRQADDIRRREEFEDVLTANIAACERANGHKSKALAVLQKYIRYSYAAVPHSLKEVRWLEGSALAKARVHDVTITVKPVKGRSYQRTYWIVASDKASAEKLVWACEPQDASIAITEHSSSGRSRADVDGGVLERTPAIPLDS